MNERCAQVLKGLVAEYIVSGEPVASSYMVNALGLGISSATMRNILVDLEEEGYIEKPHTSAGRIPTDKGYRYYVNSLVAKDINKRQREKLAGELKALQQSYGTTSRATAKMLSELASALAISGWMRAKDIHEAGLAQILKQNDAESAHAIREISMLLDNVDAYLQQIASEKMTGTNVYIGSENPLFDAMHTSSITRSVITPTGEQVILLIIGPRRMAYQRNVSWLNSIASILEEGPNI